MCRDVHALCSLCLDSKCSQLERRSTQQDVDHHTNSMSRHAGGEACPQTPGAFRVMFGQMQVLLQLGIDCFADQTHAVALRLGVLGAERRLVFFDRSQQAQRASLLQRDLKIRISIEVPSPSMDVR